MEDGDLEQKHDDSPIGEIILRAWTDPDFKKELTENPHEVFSKFGLLSEKSDFKINIVENTDDEVFFILPKRPDLDNLSHDKIRELIDSIMAVQLVLPTILTERF